MSTLAVKYRPSTFSDVVEQDVVKSILTNQIKEHKIRNAYLFCGSAGCGKAQPMYSKVLTPQGFITMGDVHVGTPVITHNGHVSKVTDVFPQGARDIYEITLSDKTKIRVADNHLNVVYIYNQTKKVREDFVLTTLELIDFVKNCKYKVRVDVPKVDFPKQDVPMDPYLLGCLIGDGSLHNNAGISNSEKDILEKINRLVGCYNCELEHTSKYDYRIKRITDSFKHFYTFEGVTYEGPYKLIDRLVELGYPRFDSNTIFKLAEGTAKVVFSKYPDLIGKICLQNNLNYNPENKVRTIIKNLGLDVCSKEKFIPRSYLFNDRNTRLELLRGLFDTDGYTGKNGQTVFATSSAKLSEDFAFLVRSLGCRDTVSVKDTSYVNPRGERIVCSNSYVHHIKFPNDMIYCSSQKHLARRKKRQSEPLRSIVNIEYVGKEECQCIYVEHDDHTYISDDFIPTHNTTSARLFANELNSSITELDAASHSSVEDIRDLIKNSKLKPMGTDYRVYIIDEAHSLSNQAWQALLKTLEEPTPTSIFLFCTTDPQKIPGTILSRVQRYEFKKITHKSIVNRLIYILEEENKQGCSYTYTTDALDYIAKLSEGGMRDAITLLEKALGFSDDITMQTVTKALGTVDYDTMFNLTNSLYNMNKKETIEIIETVHRDGLDLKQFIKNYTYFVLDLCKYNICKNFNYLQMPNTYESTLASFTPDQYSFFTELLDVVTQLGSDIKWESTPKPFIEAKLVLLCSEG